MDVTASLFGQKVANISPGGIELPLGRMTLLSAPRMRLDVQCIKENLLAVGDCHKNLFFRKSCSVREIFEYTCNIFCYPLVSSHFAPHCLNNSMVVSRNEKFHS